MAIQIAHNWSITVLMLTLRIAPLFVVAPPFSQLRVPARVRLCMALSLSACLAMAAPRSEATVISGGELLVAVAGEFFLGLALAFAFQAASAALSFSGRVLDVQAGYGLAMVVDPGSRAQAPLFGTLFTLVAGVIFLSSGGGSALLELLFSLVQLMPPGQVHPIGNPEAFIAWFGGAFALGLVPVASSMLGLFLIDVTIAFLSRTLPQMNALMIGLQVKAVAVIIVSAMSVGLLGPSALQLFNRAIGFIPSLS